MNGRERAFQRWVEEMAELERRREEEEDRKGGADLMGPLVDQAAGPAKYKPFSMTDVQTLSLKLPPLSQGGRPFIQALEGHTGGTMLAVGDVQALCGTKVAPWQMQRVYEDAWGQLSKVPPTSFPFMGAVKGVFVAASPLQTPH